MVLNKTRKKANLKSVYYGIILFMYIYEFHFLNTPSLLSSRKIVFSFIFILFLFSVYKKKDILIQIDYKKEFKIIASYLIFIIGYLLFLILIYGYVEESSYIFMRVVYFSLYAIFGSFLFANIFTNINNFFNGIIVASILQSTIVYMQFLSPGVRSFLENTFVNEGNISFLRENRANGLGAEGAYLSLLLFCGLFVCSYYIIKLQKTKLFFAYLYILISSLLVARTGFYLGMVNIIVLIIFIFKEKMNVKSLINTFRILILGLIILSIFWVVGKSFVDPDRIQKIITWSTSLWKSGVEDRSYVELSNMAIPKLTVESLFGTGIFRGQSVQGTTIQHDSGYVQSYFAMGLINAILFYLIIFIFSIRLIRELKDKVTRHYFYFYFIIMVIIEIKEPFILKYMIPFILFTSILLIKKNSKGQGDI